MVRALINTEATVGGVTMISKGGAYGYTGALVEMQSVDDAAAACDRLNGVAVPVNISRSTFTHWELRGGAQTRTGTLSSSDQVSAPL